MSDQLNTRQARLDHDAERAEIEFALREFGLVDCELIRLPEAVAAD